MLEFLTTQLFWWHWIIIGILLIISEMFTGTFIMLGLGLATILVGVVDNIYPISFEMQLTLWITLSILSIALWFKYLKDTSVESSGQSNYSLETRGTIEEAIESNGRGMVKFDTPVLGNTHWPATSKTYIPANSRVKIVAIKGQLIEVKEI
jgi:inner membrane protein